MLTSHVYTKCTLGLVALEKAEIDLHAFKQQALSSLIALQSIEESKGDGWGSVSVIGHN